MSGILRAGEGIAGRYLACSPDTVSWGTLPGPGAAPVLTVGSGEVVTFDTVSQEGLMEDQGRDPAAYFAGFGVPREAVLDEAVALAASDLRRERPAQAGPHVVLGPVRVLGAEPGDWLRVDFLDLRPRVPYGVISSRHGRGCLPDRLPDSPVFSRFCSLNGAYATFEHRGGRASIELRPFLGLCGVTPAEPGGPLSTIPPGPFGGNIDLRELVAGSSLYLPVQIPGAGFFLGDPHFAQGNGEIALTALEGSLRVTLRVSVIKPPGPLDHAAGPFAETADHWVVLGLHEDLDEAMRRCAWNAVRFLSRRTGMTENEAYLYLSAAGDFSVTQVVDLVKGVHCRIRKRDVQQERAPAVHPGLD
ncbi:acetamidase/formamidase family protein [Actinomadura rugatobispora]|uniref:Acetamidase/formamidase family protein n=1 Tax=Actinomadura rugatobispora TaxID=1994 RepID=A0ABW1A1Z3_9ACTN|nr:acetamidase/formamidase family protein [Actinomadura rugatobispora]